MATVLSRPVPKGDEMKEERTRVYLGQILVRNNLLRYDQVMTILKQQRQRHRPFGLLAEELFDVDPAEVEAAWLEQYRSYDTTAADLDTETPDPDTLDALSRRQAWQFRALPLRREDGWLVVATDEASIKRTLRFLERALPEPVHVMLAEPRALTQALTTAYGPSPARVRLAAALSH